MQRNKGDRYTGQWYMFSTDVFELTIIFFPAEAGGSNNGTFGVYWYGPRSGQWPQGRERGSSFKK